MDLSCSDLLMIRDLILKDVVALQKWPRVVDHLVISPVDQMMIKELYTRRGEYEEAVLRTLQIWRSYGQEAPDLLHVLYNLGLNRLAEQLIAIVPQTLEILEPNAEPAEVPEPGIWFEVRDVVHNFTGREAELQTLHQMMTESLNMEEGNLVCVTAVTGLPGIGKSALIREYAFRHTQFYDGNAIWINAESADSMRGSFRRLGEFVGLSVTDSWSNEELSSKVYEYLNHRKMLLIFDNVEDMDSLTEFKPSTQNSNHGRAHHVIITSRRRDLVSAEIELELQPFKLSEAMQLIKAEVPHAIDLDVKRLAERLGRVPLALQQAVAYIVETCNPDDPQVIAKYLEELKTSQISLLNDRKFQEVSDYEFSTMTALNLTLLRVQALEDGKKAMQVVKMLSYVNPDLISEEFVGRIMKEEFHRVEPCVKLLQKFSIINGHPKWVSINGLVQSVISAGLAQEDEVRVLEQVVHALRLELKDFNFTDMTRECTTQTHAIQVFSHLVKHGELLRAHANFVSKLCYYLVQYGNTAESYSIATQSVEILETLPDVDNSTCHAIVRLKWRLADAQGYMDNNEEALKILESIYPVAEEELQDSKLAVTIRSSMAHIQSHLGNHEQAIDIYDKIIPMQVEFYGGDEETPGVLTDMLNRGGSLLELNWLDEAEQVFHSVHGARLRRPGKTHLLTMRSKRWIGKVASKKGNKNTALVLYKEVYDVYKRVLNENHPNTVTLRSDIEKLEVECGGGAR